MPSEVSLGVRSPKGLLPQSGRQLQLRCPVARVHVMIHKFHLPFHAITGHKLGVTSCADGSGGQIALRTSPLASGLPLTCKALPFAGGASAPYLPGCTRQLLTVRCAHYAEGASRSTFGFVTIVPRYLLGQVMPSHSFAALTALIVRRVNGFADRPLPACTGRPHAPRRGIGVRTRQRHLAAARAKKNLKLCAKQLEVKKFPAPCYSPIVNYTVPSPLEPLTTVFGKGTCVSAPLSAPEKITIKKTSPGIISKIQSSRLSNIC